MMSTKNILIGIGLVGLAYWYWKGMNDKKKKGAADSASDKTQTKSEFIGGGGSAKRFPKECFQGSGGRAHTLWSDGSVTLGCVTRTR